MWFLFSVIVVILIAAAITIPMIILNKKSKTNVSTTIITTTATPDIPTMNIAATDITTNTGKTTTETKRMYILHLILFSWNEIKHSYIFSFIVVPLYNLNITASTKWEKNGITIAGGNGNGNQLNQLFDPCSIYIYDDETIYIVDRGNNRIIEWKRDAIDGKVVAGGNGQGQANNQLYHPFDVIIDKKTDSLIICDSYNNRLVRWPRQNGVVRTVLIKTTCYGLAMDDKEYLYIADHKNHVVKRWRMGDANVTIVAGGNGIGGRNNQLYHPTYIFVDQNYSIYIVDYQNDRVMTWEQDAKESILVAHESNEGNEQIKLEGPFGVIVDHLGHIYIVENSYENRITRWLKGTSNASIILGTGEYGNEPYQFNCANHLSFDGEGNIYVADTDNNQVQKFNINSY